MTIEDKNHIQYLRNELPEVYGGRSDDEIYALFGRKIPLNFEKFLLCSIFGGEDNGGWRRPTPEEISDLIRDEVSMVVA